VGVRFGTDGIRGVANAELGAEVVLALGRAAARMLPARAFVVGRDTRRSGPLLQAALSAGMASEGADVVDLGVIPTPGVAWAASRRGLPGAVISASHNPFTDNGVKLIGAGGLKLSDTEEEAVEAELDRILTGEGKARRPPTGPAVGVLVAEHESLGDYVEHLVAATEGRDLAGLKVVVDCANGAASTVAPTVLGRLGADLRVVCAEPDGTNINAGCGSTDPELLAAEVRSSGAEVGLALDGDADRLLAVDHTGTVWSGDELLALFAADLAARGRLAGNTVVVTVMSNLGLRLALAEQGITVRETPVGDRYVLEALEADGLTLGGEQSGHLVFRDLATTGDGVLTGVLLLDLLRRSGRPLAELAAAAMVRLPQVLHNVAVADPAAVVGAPEVQDELAAVRQALGERGRVVLRASGTEPLVRVMVEAPEARAAADAAGRLGAVVAAAAERLGAVVTAAGSPSAAPGARSS
jgi:phosphoglucosamine mutase